MLKLNVFISSPGDLMDAREAARDVISEINELDEVRERFCLVPLAWEKIAPSVAGESPQAIVNRYMMEAAHAQIYICFLWTRMGTPVTDESSGETFQSGTEYEFMKAYRATQQTGFPRILLYRCICPISPDIEELDQLLLAQNFFRRFKGSPPELKGLVKNFETISEFKEVLSRDILTFLEHDFNDFELPPDARGEPSESVQRRDFFRHIALPPNYIPRESEMAELRSTILSDSKEIVITSGPARTTTTLHGMGGIGKSVMARALCDDPQVLAAFPDGILWTTLGLTPNLSQCLRDLIQTLGGSANGPAPTLEMLAEELSKLLKERSCLMIVDDVWKKEHLEPFMATGPYCRLLITTRNATIARQIGALIYPVQAMPKEEAFQLLEAWSNKKLDDASLGIKEEVVERLDRLPLAIKLAGAQIQQTSLEDWLRDFDTIKNLRSDWITEDRDSSVAACFRLSLDDLDARIRHLYVSLGIFREDDPIPVKAICRLWNELEGTNLEDVKRILRSLGSRALLEFRDIETGDGIILHDLLLQMINEELGESLIPTHRSILDAYAKTRKGSGWETANDDGYLFDHLAYHLENAGKIDELRKLFTDQMWMNARFRQNDFRYDGYIDDLERFWRIKIDEACGQIESGEEETTLIDCFRCAFIRTSINSVAATYPPEILARAVEIGVFSLDRALSIVSQIPDEGQRLDSIVALLRSNTLDDESRRALCQMGFELAIRKDSSGFKLLCPVINEEYLPDMLSAVFADKECPYALYGNFADIMPRLNEKSLESVLNFVTTLPEIFHAHTPRHTALEFVAPYLPPKLINRALDIVLNSESGNRIRAFIAFLSRIDEPRRTELVDLAWAEILELPPTNLGLGHTNCGGPDAMALIAPFLSDERKKQASEILFWNMRFLFNDPRHSANVIECFSPHFHISVLPDVIEFAKNLPKENLFMGFDSMPYALALCALLPRLQDLNMTGAVTSVIQWTIENNQKLDKLAAGLTENSAWEAVNYAVDNDVKHLPEFALNIFPFLSTDQKCFLLEKFDLSGWARLDGDKVSLSDATRDLPNELFDKLVYGIIEAESDENFKRGGSSHIGFYSDKQRNLMQLAFRMSEANLELYFRTRKTDESSVAFAIARLLPKMDEETKKQGVEVLIKLFPYIPEPLFLDLGLDRKGLVEIIISELTPKVLEIFVDLIRAHKNAFHRINELLKLLPYLSEEMRRQIIAEIKTDAWSVDPSDWWGYPMVRALIIDLLDEEERDKTIREFFASHPDYDRGDTNQAIDRILPFLEPAEMKALMESARQHQVYVFNQGYETRPLTLLPTILKHLLPYMSSDEIEEVDLLLDTVASDAYPKVIDYRYYPAKLQLFPYLSRENIEKTLNYYVESIERSKDDIIKSTLDKKILVHLDESMLSRLFDAVLLYPPYSRIGPLRVLIPRLTHSERTRALTILQDDILSLHGIRAVEELDAALDLFEDTESSYRMLKKELVNRMYIDRGITREEMINISTFSNTSSSKLWSENILSGIGKLFVDFSTRWIWI